LQIVGDSSAGYHLLRAPSGFFTADDWFLTLEEALDAAQAEFEVGREKWVMEAADEAS
jgi:hypothetical protein